MSERLGQLVADERATEHDRHLGLGNARDHALRFVEVLEVEEIGGALRAWCAQRVRSTARRDEETVVGYLAARLGMNGLLVEAHLIDLCLEAKVDAVLGMPLHVPHVDALLEEHAAQVPRKGYAVVEGVGLVVDHDDLGRRIELAQLFRGIRAGRAVSDDDKAGGVIAQFILLVLLVGLVSPNAARRVVAARSRPQDLSCASRNDGSREPRCTQLLHPRQSLLRNYLDQYHEDGRLAVWCACPPGLRD